MGTRNSSIESTSPIQMGLGGARRDRTADLLHAMQALSQLSYSPNGAAHCTGARALCQGKVKRASYSLKVRDLAGVTRLTQFAAQQTQLPSLSAPRSAPCPQGQ